MTFEDHVRRALESLPSDLRRAMENVEIARGRLAVQGGVVVVVVVLLELLRRRRAVR